MVDFTDQPDDPVEFTVPDSNEMVEEPHTKSQPAITFDQITSIVSAIVDSKIATLASTGSDIPGQAAPSTVASNINFGDPNSVHFERGLIL